MKKQRPIWQTLGIAGFFVFAIGYNMFFTHKAEPAPPIVAATSSQTQCDLDVQQGSLVDHMQDTVTDFDPAVRSCRTFADWVAATVHYPSAVNGVDPWVFASNRCADAESNLAETPLCQELMGLAGATALPQTTNGSPGSVVPVANGILRYSQTWPQSYKATTCPQWTDSMTPGQRFVAASEMLQNMRRGDTKAADDWAGDAMFIDFGNAITTACETPAADPINVAEVAASLYVLDPKLHP